MNQANIRVDFRIVSLALVAIIGIMLGFWRPWENGIRQTVTISGQATIKAEPDEFTFSPVYQRSAATSTAAISEVSAAGNKVVVRLEELGVEERLITTSVTTSQGYEPATGRPISGYSAQYTVRAITYDKKVAQKVLEYIVTTSPLYGVSPQSTFRSETQKVLENKARAKAVADAKAKAESTAAGLDLKLGRVASISEAQWDGPVPVLGSKGVAEDNTSSSTVTSPTLLTGEQDVTYTVTVVFGLK